MQWLASLATALRRAQASTLSRSPAWLRIASVCSNPPRSTVVSVLWVSESTASCLPQSCASRETRANLPEPLALVRTTSQL